MAEPGAALDVRHDGVLHRCVLLLNTPQLRQNVPRSIQPAVLHLDVKPALEVAGYGESDDKLQLVKKISIQVVFRHPESQEGGAGGDPSTVADGTLSQQGQISRQDTRPVIGYSPSLDILPLKPYHGGRWRCW